MQRSVKPPQPMLYCVTLLSQPSLMLLFNQNMILSLIYWITNIYLFILWFFKIVIIFWDKGLGCNFFGFFFIFLITIIQQNIFYWIVPSFICISYTHANKSIQILTKLLVISVIENFVAICNMLLKFYNLPAKFVCNFNE